MILQLLVQHTQSLDSQIIHIDRAWIPPGFSKQIADVVEHSTYAMTRRIQVAIDAECDASYPRLRAAKVSLSTRDGRAFERYVPEPYGAASNPLSDAALKAKFIGLATKRVGQLRALEAFDLLWNIETLANLEPLLTLLRPMSPC